VRGFRFWTPKSITPFVHLSSFLSPQLRLLGLSSSRPWMPQNPYRSVNMYSFLVSAFSRPRYLSRSVATRHYQPSNCQGAIFRVDE
jgi:hypothetical protein